MTNWISDIFRSLFFWLDGLVYTVIDWIYQLFISIAQINIEQTIVKSFASRIYAFLGIYMLFRLTFSLITYLINPDNLKDKQKGAGGFAQRIFVSIILMAFVPFIFDEAFEVQGIILKKNILGQVILGISVSDDSQVTTNMSTTGQEMAFTVFSAFFRPNSKECENPFSNGSVTSQCRAAIGDSVANTYEAAYKNKKVNDLGSILNTKDGNGEYVIHYQAVVSTIAGGFVAWIIMLFCIDISLRVVKLVFLQLIAPVPIISYIDPKGADGMFKKWYTNCFKTYADVFIRLGAIYFAIFIISLLTKGFFDGNAFYIGYGTSKRTLTNIEAAFVILGVLMFAKQLPDLLKDLLGVDLKGDFSLNPMKKMASIPLAGGALAAGLGIAGNSALAGGRLTAGLAGSAFKGLHSAIKGNGFVSGFKSSWSTDKEKARMRMKAGLQASRENITNWSGDGKYKSSGETYKSLTENYKKGTDEFKKIHKSWAAGEKARIALDDKGFDFKNFDGDKRNKAAYQTVYRHEDFIQSLMSVDSADNENKAFQSALYEAQTNGGANVEVIKDGKVYQFGNGSKKSGTNASGLQYEDGGSFADLKSEAEKAQKKLGGLEKVHETMRMTYSEDAEMQDNIKFRKNNPDDPTSFK